MKRFLLFLAACSSPPPEPAAKPVAPPAAPIGTLVSSAELVGNTYTIRALGTQVDLATMPLVKAFVGLPVTGKADVDVAIDIGNGNAELTYGHANLACTHCQLGDDVAKLQVGGSARARAFAGDGIAIGHLAIDHAAMKAVIENGIAEDHQLGARVARRRPPGQRQRRAGARARRQRASPLHPVQADRGAPQRPPADPCGDQHDRWHGRPRRLLLDRGRGAGKETSADR